eukprot:12938784-Prorocentrum_lima.AAC.1
MWVCRCGCCCGCGEVAADTRACTSRFRPPPVPVRATDHNGIKLADACFEGRSPHHVFVIGDWGGVMPMNPGEP